MHFFIVDDLVKYSQNEEYKNSNKKWKKYYTTTIVMPIRYLRNPDEKKKQFLSMILLDAYV